MAGPTQGNEPVQFRCLEDGHTFEQRRDARAPLVLRQSAWCEVHDAPAVCVPNGAAADFTQ